MGRRARCARHMATYEAVPEGLEILVFGAPSLGENPRGHVEGSETGGPTEASLAATITPDWLPSGAAVSVLPCATARARLYFPRHACLILRL